jgi:hypothetical protein
VSISVSIVRYQPLVKTSTWAATPSHIMPPRDPGSYSGCLQQVDGELGAFNMKKGNRPQDSTQYHKPPINGSIWNGKLRFLVIFLHLPIIFPYLTHW